MGCVQGLGWRHGLGGLPTPLVVLSAGGRHNTLLLLPAFQKLAVGFLVFLYLALQNVPQLCMHTVISSPL